MEEKIDRTLERTLKEIEERNSKALAKQLSCSCGNDAEFGKYDCIDCLNKKTSDRWLGDIHKALPQKYWDIDTDMLSLLASSQNKSLFINGNPGSGKTVFACSMAKETLKNGIVKFVSYPAFIMELQSAFKADKENPFDIASEVAKFPGLLIIDDLGAEKITDFVRQITYFILNEREQWKLQTIITSNFSLPQLDEQIDARISSRIAGMCKILKFTGKDRRING